MNSFYYEKTINHIADQLSNCEDWDVSTDESLSDIFVFHIKNCYPQIKLAIIRNIFEKYTSIPIKDKMELSFDIKKLISANY